MIEISQDIGAETPFLIVNVSDIYATSINCSISSVIPDTELFELLDYENKCMFHLIRVLMYLDEIFGCCGEGHLYSHLQGVIVWT
jgi:hypothetical protein